MKESHSEDEASHTGPESCEGVRKGALEALTGETAGRAIEPRKQDKFRGADALMAGGRPHGMDRQRQEPSRPCGVEEPRHAGTLPARKPGDPESGPPREGQGPHREPPGGKRVMNGHGKSDRTRPATLGSPT
jgi:hypothetical protein